MREIPLTRGKVALVDDADWLALSQFSWHASFDKTGNRWYARRGINLGGGKFVTVRMHRQLLPGVRRIDHADGDGLNNQRHNLRKASRAQNAQNSKVRADNRSGFKGVEQCSTNCWRVTIVRQGRKTRIGGLRTAEHAARVYDEWARKFFGVFARTNF